MPPERKDVDFIESEKEFSITLVRAVKRGALNGLNSRPALLVEPLLTVTYADGKQRMITFTGLILRADQRDVFRTRARFTEWPYQPGDNWDSFVTLAVPHLSLRERQMIHAKMHSISWAFAAHLLDFELDQEPEKHVDSVNQYMTHYRRYPTFAHSDIL